VTEPAPAVEDAIRALAHPGRRTMLRLVWDQERPASELAEAAGLSRSAASQHLKLLREAGLVHVRVDATRRLYRADLDRVAEVAALLDDFWATPLERLKAVTEHRARTRDRKDHEDHEDHG
jgi:DNA-binding transcriptional ArsR family regulator